MHTTSLYPTPNHLVRLGAITEKIKTFKDILVGFSDHTTDNLSSFAATTLGAKIIERHFSDKKRIGPDIVSSNFEKDLKDLINGSKKIFEQLGGVKNKLKEETVTRKFAYASVVAIKDINKGERLSQNNIWVKRPGTGDYLAPNYFKLIGKKSKKNIKRGNQLKITDIY